MLVIISGGRDHGCFLSCFLIFYTFKRFIHVHVYRYMHIYELYIMYNILYILYDYK